MTSTVTDRIDGITTSAAVKAPCKAAATAAIVLSGEQTVNGTACVDGDRVLVAGQASSVTNGIYICRTSSWERAPDFDGNRDVVNGTLVIVGSSGNEVLYKTVATNPVVIGTSAITFTLAAFGDLSTLGFTQAGTGAVPRNAQIKMREIVSPEDFGAAGDGLTNDASAFATAIATLTTNGELHLTPGKTYLIGSAGFLISGKTNVHIRGNGAVLKISAASVLLNTVNGSAFVKFLNCTRCSISNVEIDGNAKASDAVTFATCTDCVMENVRAYSCGATGVLTSFNGTRNTIRNCLVYSGVGTARGIWCGNTNAGQAETDLAVLGNIVRNNPATGIVCVSTGGRIEGNHCKSNAGSGIITSGANSITASKVSIIGNVCESNSFHGIQSDISFATAADVASDIVVSGNQCNSNASTGIYAVYAYRWAISGNSCRDNVAAGIYASRCDRLVITGNECCDSRSGGSRTQTIGIGLVCEVGIAITDVTISGNDCSNNTQDGIRIQNTTAETITGLTVTGNTCHANSSRGLAISDAVAALTSFRGVTVSGNSCYGNTTTDLRVDPLEAAIDGNVFNTALSVGYWSFTSLDATPSVKGNRKMFRCANGGATTITDFDDQHDGQVIEVWFTNANTTINHGGNFSLQGAANLAPVPANAVIRFFYTGTVWLEISRNF